MELTYPIQSGVATKDVVSRVTDVFIHQEVSPPHDCIVCFGALPTRDASRDTTAVERSSLSIGDTVFATHGGPFFDLHSGTCCGYGWKKKKL